MIDEYLVNYKKSYDIALQIFHYVLNYDIIIIMKNTIQNITSLISNKKKQYLQEGFEIIGIFGSYARGNESKYSDVDIAYRLDMKTFDRQFKGGFSKLLRIEEIKEELQKVLHLKVDLVSMTSDNVSLKKNIEKDMLYV